MSFNFTLSKLLASTTIDWISVEAEHHIICFIKPDLASDYFENHADFIKSKEWIFSFLRGKRFPLYGEPDYFSHEDSSECLNLANVYGSIKSLHYSDDQGNVYEVPKSNNSLSDFEVYLSENHPELSLSIKGALESYRKGNLLEKEEVRERLVVEANGPPVKKPKLQEEGSGSESESESEYEVDGFVVMDDDGDEEFDDSSHRELDSMLNAQ